MRSADFLSWSALVFFRSLLLSEVGSSVWGSGRPVFSCPVGAVSLGNEVFFLSFYTSSVIDGVFLYRKTKSSPNCWPPAITSPARRLWLNGTCYGMTVPFRLSPRLVTLSLQQPPPLVCIAFSSPPGIRADLFASSFLYSFPYLPDLHGILSNPCDNENTFCYPFFLTGLLMPDHFEGVIFLTTRRSYLFARSFSVSETSPTFLYIPSAWLYFWRRATTLSAPYALFFSSPLPPPKDFLLVDKQIVAPLAGCVLHEPRCFPRNPFRLPSPFPLPPPSQFVFYRVTLLRFLRIALCFTIASPRSFGVSWIPNSSLPIFPSYLFCASRISFFEVASSNSFYPFFHWF